MLHAFRRAAIMRCSVRVCWLRAKPTDVEMGDPSQLRLAYPAWDKQIQAFSSACALR
jgi:hypothetical protein